MKKAIKNQYGFALLEVLIAALILTVGGVAFMKLQRMGLQYGFSSAARTQGTVIVENFIEQLRSNVSVLRTSKTPISGNFLGGQINKTTKKVSCDSKINPKDCAETIFSMHKYIISQQMQNIAPKNNTRLCYIESPTESGFIRVTFQWIDNSEEGKKVDLSAKTKCPSFNETIKQNNSVTIYAQI